jgi:hypothetical protein
MVSKYFRHVADCSKTEICDENNKNKRRVREFGSSLSRLKTAKKLTTRHKSWYHDVARTTGITGDVDILSYSMNRKKDALNVCKDYKILGIAAVENNNLSVLEYFAKDYRNPEHPKRNAMFIYITYLGIKNLDVSDEVIKYVISLLDLESLNDIYHR